MTKALWQPPRLRRDEEQVSERHATWLELFYDLVFVAATAELAHSLSGNISWAGCLKFAILFVPIWWCWVGATFYATRFDIGSIVDRLFALVQMAIVAAMAVNVHHGLSSSGSGFAICYVLFRVTLILQYLNAGHHIPAARSLTTWYATGFGLSAGLWLVSAFLPPPLRLGLWVVSLAIDLSTPLSAGRLVAKIPPSMPHVLERIGLFTLIVLGESVIGVVGGLAEHEWSLGSILVGLLGLAIAFSLWWLYFDTADGSPLKSMKVGKMRVALTWLYAHLPLAMGLVAAGVGVEHLIAHDATAIPSSAERWLLCSAIATCLLVLAGIHYMSCALGTARYRKILSAYRTASAVLVLLLAMVGDRLSSLNLVTLVALACVVQVRLDLLRSSVAPRPATATETSQPSKPT